MAKRKRGDRSIEVDHQEHKKSKLTSPVKDHDGKLGDEDAEANQSRRAERKAQKALKKQQEQRSKGNVEALKGIESKTQRQEPQAIQRSIEDDKQPSSERKRKNKKQKKEEQKALDSVPHDRSAQLETSHQDGWVSSVAGHQTETRDDKMATEQLQKEKRQIRKEQMQASTASDDVLVDDTQAKAKARMKNGSQIHDESDLRRRKEKKLHNAVQEKNPANVQATPLPQGLQTSSSLIRLNEEERRKLSDDEQKRSLQTVAANKEAPSWKLSPPTGGQMLDLDPTFSLDQEYLFIPFQAYVAVYATSTSLLLRKLHIDQGQRIASVALCDSTPDRLYIALSSGSIEAWDWSEGRRISSKQTQHETTHISLVTQDDVDIDAVVFAVQKLESNQKWQLSSYVWNCSEGESNIEEMQTLYTSETPLTSLQPLHKGRHIILTSGHDLIIGAPSKDSDSQRMHHKWRIMACPEWIVSIDTRASPLNSDQQARSHQSRNYPPIDVAIGGLKGSIHLYSNILQNLFQTQKSGQQTKKTGDIMSRHLHWHRSAVHTVKWSPDGNYLISGGLETVLVMWQLDTGSKDQLPHLGAPIESIVVSPDGASYGIRLADNSAMILTTMEMKPSFSISGVQIHGHTSLRQMIPSIQTVDNSNQIEHRRSDLRHAACIRTTKMHQILFAVPSHQSSRTSRSPQSSSYLQTFDMTSGHQLARQALTRTNTTNLNMGPESNTIEDPNVTHMATSQDGKWLATVDEWMPPASDLEPLAFDKAKLQEDTLIRREIRLKFWIWSDKGNVWELVTRVDQPHASETGKVHESGSIVAIASDPSSAAFATLGEDGYLKAWKPVTRRRGGIVVRGKDGLPLKNWHCRFSTAIGSTGQSKEHKMAASLTYSPDGSLIALGVKQQNVSPIYLIDSLTGIIEKVQTGLAASSLHGLGIIDRYLIVLSKQLIVWDLVNDKQEYATSLKFHQSSPADQAIHTHLAINLKHNTFSIAIPQSASSGQKKSLKAQVAIFDVSSPNPLFISSLQNPVTALLPAVGQKGYYIVDTAAEITTLSPIQAPIMQIEPPKAELKPRKGLSDILGKGNAKRPLISMDENSETDGKNAVNVTPQQLAAIFDQGPAYALPPVQQLFEQVADLIIGRKPIATASIEPQ
ncbi:uncharacterized protein KY384_001625 [Bacidia gigantensis]|uniref:uncharacterized protein n=1 Tax=Bacidia gigantensis TaxID=2732470 RepID=UPI001D058A24|nr:uncharacterized protein KY384_001625 [Bacidia gigantensis]KAG8533884.1 hypothetical protein KY384_001625 [Bacidia gigantensis]